MTTTIVNGEVVYDASSSTAGRARAAAPLVSRFRHDYSVDCLQAGACCCAINDQRLKDQNYGLNA